jgi:cytoskeletal protein CcmA (bactofilin family)
MSLRKVPPQAPHAEPSAGQETVIGPGVHIKGDLQGTANVELKGTVEGNVNVDGLLVVGKGGKVIGDISATSVYLDGEVAGNIQAKEKARLSANAKLKGNLQASSLSIQEGARFQGRVGELPSHSGFQKPKQTPEAALEEAPLYQ